MVSVLLFHLDEQLGREAASSWGDRSLAAVVRRGFLGVPIFFAISAFIVALPFARSWLHHEPRVRLRAFYLRRITRLEPPYIINLVVLWVLGAALGYWSLAQHLPGLLASLVYQHNLVFGEFSSITSVVWSLEVEFQFYLLAPALALMFAVRCQGWRWFILALAVTGIVGLRSHADRRVELSLLGQFEAFAVGLFVVDVYLTRWNGRLPGRASLDVLGLAGWLGFFGLSRLEDPVVRSLAQTACLAAGMLGSLGGRRLAGLFGNRWVFTFGGMCYSFYLWHQWIMIEMVRRGAIPNAPDSAYTTRFAIASCLVMPVVAALCTLLFVALEKPFMRRDWPRRFGQWLRRLV